MSASGYWQKYVHKVLDNCLEDKPAKEMCVTVNPCPAELKIYPAFANSVDPDQLASSEAN